MPIEQRTIRIRNLTDCKPVVYGCTDPLAINHVPGADEVDPLFPCRYGNDEKTKVYTKNTCPQGQTGSSYEFTVKANEYIASSKAQANLDRDADMDIRGQFLANQGNCIPPNPTESGLIELSRAEYAEEKIMGGGQSRPSMIRVKLLRTSQNGSSAVSGRVEIRTAPGSGLLEAMPRFTFQPGSLCTTVQTTMGLPSSGTYYAVLVAIEQSGYQTTATNYQSVNRVTDFSQDVVCLQ